MRLLFAIYRVSGLLKLKEQFRVSESISVRSDAHQAADPPQEAVSTFDFSRIYIGTVFEDVSVGHLVVLRIRSFLGRVITPVITSCVYRAIPESTRGS